MVLSAHLLVGAAIGSKIKNYWAIFILALISHFILDAIPHWEYVFQLTGISGNEFLTATTKALLDILIGIGIVSVILKPAAGLARPALFGAFSAILPDSFFFAFALAQVFFSWQLNFFAGFIAFHNKIHYLDGNLFFWRIITEAIIAAIAVFIIWQSRQATKQ